MTPTWSLRINFTGTEDCGRLSMSNIKEKGNKGMRAVRRILLSVSACGVYSAAVHIP